MKKFLSMWFASVAMAAPAAIGEIEIDRLAPEDSVILVSVKNAQQSIDRIKNTGLWGLWQSDSMKALRTKAMVDIQEMLDELYDELDIDEDALSLPDGPVGFALFPMVEDDFTQSVGFLLVADYGDNADRMNKLVDAALEKAADEGELEFDTDEILGRKVLSLEMSQLDGDDFGDQPIRDPFGDMPMPGPPDMVPGFDNVHFVRDDSRFLFSSHMESLGEALEAIDEGDAEGVTERRDFQGVMRQLGTTDAYFVVLVDGLIDMISGGDPMIAMFESMFQAIVGDIRAIAMGVRIDTATAMVENRGAIYMPNGRSGLLSLCDTASPRGRVPSFVGPQVISYSAINFEFEGLMELIRTIGRTNPLFQQQIDMFMVDFGEDVEIVCGALGPEVHSISTLEKPIKIDSVKSVAAIRCRRPNEVEQILVKYAGPMLEARDFLGHRIYSMPMNPLAMGGQMMDPDGDDGLSIGFGGGYVFMGTTSQVEDSLRASGGADMPTLESNPAFRQALRSLPHGDLVAWGVADIAGYIDYFKNLDLLVQEQTIAQIRQWNPEYADEMARDFRKQDEPPWRKLDADVIRRFLGPSSWECRVDEDGFVMSSSLLPPGGK